MKLNSPTPSVWNTGTDLPNLGEATGDQQVACDSFLILPKDAMIVTNRMIMFNGLPRFDIRLSENLDSVRLTPGGRWKDGSFISGGMDTLSKSEFSRRVMRAVRTALRKHFTKISAFWVGPEALIELRKGTRLTYAIQSPPEYGLRENPSG